MTFTYTALFILASCANALNNRPQSSGNLLAEVLPANNKSSLPAHDAAMPGDASRDIFASTDQRRVSASLLHTVKNNNKFALFTGLAVIWYVKVACVCIHFS